MFWTRKIVLKNSRQKVLKLSKLATAWLVGETMTSRESHMSLLPHTIWLPHMMSLPHTRRDVIQNSDYIRTQSYDVIISYYNHRKKGFTNSANFRIHIKVHIVETL